MLCDQEINSQEEKLCKFINQPSYLVFKRKIRDFFSWKIMTLAIKNHNTNNLTIFWHKILFLNRYFKSFDVLFGTFGKKKRGKNLIRLCVFPNKTICKKNRFPNDV